MKTGSDLRDNPIPRESATKQPDAINTPFDKSLDVLSTTEGNLLEITTRTTPAIANAGQVALCYRERFVGSKYIAMLYEQIERQAIALGGKGRSEVVEITKYGAGVPPTFYNEQGTEKRSFIPTSRNDDGNTT